MLTIEEFDLIESGDHVQTQPLFKTISKEPLVLIATSKADYTEEVLIKFIATYFGVNLGNWECLKKEGKLQWTL